MKRLTLIRHARSSWDHSELRDYERPLNKRGRRDAPLMGCTLADRINPPGVILCSPAVRAKTTAEMVVEAMGLDSGLIREDDRLYNAGTRDVLDVIRELEASCRHALLVGHCPSMLDTTNLLCGEQIERLPTCGTMLLKAAVEQWSSVAANACTLDEFLYPKMLKKD